jgi:hypothetical protein
VLQAGEVPGKAAAEKTAAETAGAVGEDRAGEDRAGQDRAGQDRAGQDRAGDESPLGVSGQVTVVPGIARYHRSQCILIRFLGADDLESMTREAAENANFAPCRACQPDQALAGS